MKMIPYEDLIVRKSFLLPFRGGEIWALEVDALSLHTGLATEKFKQDIKYAWRPSTTSRVAIHLKDTGLNDTFINAIVDGLKGSKGNIVRVAFIGVEPEYVNTLREALAKNTSGIAFQFFKDYEKGKEWLLP